MNNIMQTYFKIPEFIRFTIINTFNAIIALLLYFSLFLGMFFKEHFFLATLLNFLLPATFSYCTMKIFVFNNSNGKVLVEYIKTVVVIIGASLLSWLLLLFLYNVMGVSLKFMQIINITIIHLYTYFAFKYYSFNINISYFGTRLS